jgi:maltooligosyltrehalose trehalohydrolase
MTEGEIPDPQAESTLAASRLTWSWPAGSRREGLRRLYRDLLAARRHWPALRDFRHKEARLLPDEDQAAVLELVRGSAREPGTRLHVFFNLTDRSQPLPETAGSRGVWLFSSETGRYQGSRPEGEPPQRLCPYECVVFGTEESISQSMASRGQKTD